MGRAMLAQQPHGRPKVLLLGISYPSVENQMERRGFDPDVLDCKEASVEQAVECVRRGIFTEMDARDLARCVATEQVCEVDAYSVSKEVGAIYRDDRHVYGNFNARNFCNSLKKAFGDNIQFSQIILDYYWMPTGWLVARWAKTLFSQTLPDFVRMNMLTFPSKRGYKGKRSRREPKFDGGVVYLPFCAHVCKELVAAIDVLKDYYAITFVKKSELGGHSLWKGTMSIDGEIMQHRLGKRLDQEEFYCTFKKTDIYESMEDPHVSKSSVMEILEAIEDYDNIRMIRLRPLRQHEAPSVLKERLVEPEKGGFLGLNFKLGEEKRRRKEIEAKRRKEEMEKQRKLQKKLEQKTKDMERIAIKKKKEDQRKKNFQARRNEMSQKLQTKWDASQRAKRRAAEKLFEDVEESSSEESKTIYFYPGPTNDLGIYNEPEKNCASDPEVAEVERKNAKRKARRSAANRRSQKILKARQEHISLFKSAVQTPGNYLTYNPRLPKEKQMPEPISPRTEKETCSGDAVQDVYIPSINKELQGAYSLIEMRDRGFKEIWSPIYGEEELICIKIPEKDIYGLEDLSSREKVDIDRWRVRVMRQIFEAADGNRLTFIFLGRYKTLEDIMDWLRHKKHPMFDSSGDFTRLYENLELSEEQGMFEAAETMENFIYASTKTTARLYSSRTQSDSDPESSTDALSADIFCWLRNRQDKNDPTGEFFEMEHKLSRQNENDSHDFKSDYEMAKEMAHRIIIMRSFCKEWESIRTKRLAEEAVAMINSAKTTHQRKKGTPTKELKKQFTPKKAANANATRKATLQMTRSTKAAKARKSARSAKESSSKPQFLHHEIMNLVAQKPIQVAHIPHPISLVNPMSPAKTSNNNTNTLSVADLLSPTGVTKLGDQLVSVLALPIEF